MNVGQLLANSARRFPRRTAVSWGDERLTYSELDRRANALAGGLARAGVGPGERVAVLMRNRPEALESMFACFKGGYCLVPLNSRFTAEEVAFHVGDSGARAVITDTEGASVAVAAATAALVIVAGPAPQVPGPAGHETVGHETVGYETVVAAGSGSPVAADVDRDDLAWLFYTSGTTGQPKGAMLTHANLGFVTASWLADLTPMDERDVTLHAAPLSHGAGFHALAATARGAHQVILPHASFDPAAVMDVLAREGVTNTWLVPTQIVMLVDHLGGQRPHLPDLRHVVYGGAPFAPADLRQAVETFGPVFVQLFAQGETPMTATVLPARDHAEALAGDRPQRLASAGVARPGTDVRVLDSTDRELPPGQVGEVCVRGGAVMLGYWNRPDATAETLRNGWLHTGDVGRFDDHGYLYLLDRAKDMIISGGSNVYAVEVEAVLADHPDVQEVAVVGVEDRKWGEVVTAVVVPKDGADRALLVEELSSLCAGRLAGYKRPRRYVLHGPLPRNAYGKVLKRDLRAELAAGPDAGETA